MERQIVMNVRQRLRAKLRRLEEKARYYDRVRLTLHLEAVRSLIGEVRCRLAEIETGPDPSGEDGQRSARAVARGPRQDPPADCGFG